MIRIPRPHVELTKALESWEEANVWATQVDTSVQDIIASLKEAQADIASFTMGLNPKLPRHGATHFPGTGTDAIPLYDATLPAYRTGAGAVGTSNFASRRDHKHPCDYGLATLASDQTTNLSVGDHLKLANIEGSGITLDGSTAYTSGAGASIGRFTLEGGKTYRLRARIAAEFSGATGELEFQWSDDSGNLTGGRGRVIAVTNVQNRGSQNEAIAYVSPVTDTRYEVQFIGVTAFNAVESDYTGAAVETI